MGNAAEVTMLLRHPISFGKHIRSLFYFHDTITAALRRYKTAILSKQSTFLGLYQGAAAAGAENDLRLCARRQRIKRGKKEKKKKKRREREREKICTVCTFESFLNISWPSSPTRTTLFHGISVHVKSRRDIFSFFSRACMSVDRDFLFLALRDFARSTVKNLDKKPPRISLGSWDPPKSFSFFYYYTIYYNIKRFYIILYYTYIFIFYILAYILNLAYI